MKLTKRHSLDKRCCIYKRFCSVWSYIVENRYLLLLAILGGFIAGSILTSSIIQASITSPAAPQTKIDKQPLLVKEVDAEEHDEAYYRADKVRYIRYAALKAGLTDKDASMLIRIGRAESYCDINPEAVNYLYTTNPKKYSAVGSFMITRTTWDGNKCTGNRFDHYDSTDCAIKIYKNRNVQPWEESRHQDSGNGWADPHQCESYFKS